MEENNALVYEQYAQAQVTFTKEVMQSLALKSKDVVLKCGCYRLPAMLQKASFQQLVVIVPGRSFVERILDSQEDAYVSLRFTRQEDNSRPVLVELSGLVDEVETHSSDNTYALLTIDLDTAGQAVFVPLLGSLIKHTQLAHESADKWFAINAKSREVSQLSRRHCTLVGKTGERLRCFVEALSMKGADLLVTAQHGMMVGEEVTLTLYWARSDLFTSLVGVIEELVDSELSEDLVRVRVIYEVSNECVYYHNIIGKMIDAGL